jgi:MFS family permease
VIATRVRRLSAPLSWPAYRRLWLSQVLSEIGDWAARLALSALVYGQTGSAVLGSLAFIAGLLPALGPGQWLSTFGDRYGRRAVMVSCDLVRAAIFAVLALPVTWHPAVALLLAAVAGVATSPFESARAAAVIDVCEAPAPAAHGRRRAGRPATVPQDRVVAAVSLGQVTQDLATVLGYLVGGVLLVWLGASGGLAVNAATFVVSAVLLVGLPRLGRGEDEHADLAAWPRLKLASAVFVRDPLVRRGALLASFAVATATAVQSTAVPFVDVTLPDQKWLAGLALAGASVVALVATVGLPEGLDAPAALRLTAILTLVPSAAGAALGMSPAAFPALVGLIGTGGLFAALVPAVALVAPRLPSSLRATCFGLLTAGLTLMQAMLCLLAGVLADRIGPPHAMVSLLVPAVVVALVALVRPVRVVTLPPEDTASSDAAPSDDAELALS